MELWARGRRAPHAAVPVPVGLGARFCLLPCSVRRWPQQPGLCVFWWSRLGGWGRSQPVGPRGARFRGAEGGGEGPSAPARSSGLTAAVPGQSPAEKLRQGARLPRAAGNGAGQRPPLVPPVPASSPPRRAQPAEPPPLHRPSPGLCLSFPLGAATPGPAPAPPPPRSAPGHGADRAAGAAARAAAGPGPPGANQRAAHQPGPPARPRSAARAQAGGGTEHRASLRAPAPRAPHLVRPLRGLRLGRRQEEPPVPP